jgi:F-type H+-transporting ATPase subunit epsilon
LTTLKFGVVKVRLDKAEQIFAVAGGVAEVQPDLITILADAAENVEEIDISRAEEARKRAEEYLAQGTPQDTDSYLKLEAALRRSNLRLDAVKRFRRSSTKQPRFTDND